MPYVRETRHAKRTYSLDAGTVSRFERLVPAGERSRVIEELLDQRVREVEQEQLRASIHEGLADMRDVYGEVASDWQGADREGWPAE